MTQASHVLSTKSMKQVSAYKGEMRMASKRKIILEDGQQYSGLAFGDETDKVCELVFNTSMVGYQEILSDPNFYSMASHIVGYI